MTKHRHACRGAIPFAAALALLACRDARKDVEATTSVAAPAPPGPIVRIEVHAAGVSPAELEREVAEPIEQSMGSLAHRLETGILPGRVRIDVELPTGTDPFAATQLVRDAIVLEHLPTDIGPPAVSIVQPDAAMLFAIVGTTGSDPTAIVEAARMELLRQPGVRSVRTCGDPPPRWRVRVDPSRASAHGIATDEILAALEPIGGLTTTPDELSGLAVGRARLSDIAVIERRSPEVTCSAAREGVAPAMLFVEIHPDRASGAAERLREATASVAGASVSIAEPEAGRLAVVWSTASGPVHDASMAALMNAAVSVGSHAWRFDEPFEPSWLFVQGDSTAMESLVATLDRSSPVHVWPWPFAAVVAQHCSLDLAVNAAAVDDLAAAIAGSPGVRDVVVLAPRERTHEQVRFDREAVARWGLRMHDLRRLLPLAVGERVAIDSRRGDPVELSIEGDAPATALAALQLRASSGELVPLSTVATLEREADVEVLHRVDRMRCAELRVLLDGPGHREGLETRIRASHRAAPHVRLEIRDASSGMAR